MERVFLNAKWFGEYLREMRKFAGYSNTKQLSEAIEERTGVHVDPNGLDRYERGERLPGLDRFFAIVATLEGEEIDHTFGFLAQLFYEHSLDGHIALELIEQEIEDFERDIEYLDDGLVIPDKNQLLTHVDMRLRRVAIAKGNLEKLTLTNSAEEKKREELRNRLQTITLNSKTQIRLIEIGQLPPTKPAY